MTAPHDKNLKAAFPLLGAQAAGDAARLAAVADMAITHGEPGQAYHLARDARALAPGDADIESRTARAFISGVPRWHFEMVRDEARNAAFEAALARAVRPDSRILDIGAGSGLLAMMAARAGARQVMTCESNPAVADAAAAIIAANGYANRVRLISKPSTEIDPEGDLGGRADLIVSEVLSNELIGEDVLATFEDAVGRLLAPGGRVIPASGAVRVALAHWSDLGSRRMGTVSGFDCTLFNRLARTPISVHVADKGLRLRGPAADLFTFDFASGGPWREGRTSLELVSEGGAVNGIAQWIGFSLNEQICYENAPGRLPRSSWSIRFTPLAAEIDAEPGMTMRIHGAHNRRSLRIWLDG